MRIYWSSTSEVPSNTHRWAVDVARAVKRECEAPIVFGGPHVSAVPERAILEPSIDAVVEGEGEGALLDLLECTEKGRIRAHGHLELHIQMRSETGAEPCPSAPQRSRHAAPDPRRGADLGPTKLPLLPLAAEPDYPGEWCGWVQVSVTHCPYRSLLVGSSNIVTPLPSQGFRTRRDIPLVDRGREDRLLLLERTP